MQCTDAKAQLDRQFLQAETPALDLALSEHLEVCSSCRSYAQDLRIDTLLSSLPVPPMSENFARRALDKAWAATHPQDSSINRPVKAGWWMATAASVVLATGILFSSPWREAPSGMAPAMPVVQVAPQELRQVDLLMVSGTALANATITISMDANVTLAGYPNTTKVSWQAPINAGNNQLSLPVRVQRGSGGVIVVEVESGGARKQMRFAVATDSQDNAISMTI